MVAECLRALYIARNRDMGAIGRAFEDAIEVAYRAVLKPGDHAVDLGSHWGRHTWPMVECVGPEGRVHAFEAINRLYVRTILEGRRRGAENVDFYNIAVAHEERRITFSEFRENEAYSGIVARQDLADDVAAKRQDIELLACRLDDILANDLPVRFVKADIEGGEFDAFRGASRLIATQRPIIAFESGREKSAQLYGYSADDFFGFFEALGYRIFDIGGELMDREYWSKPNLTWSYYAVPEEDEAFPAQLPDFVAAIT